MSIFGDILEKIIPSHHQAAPAEGVPSSIAAPSAPASTQTVDVAQVLSDLAKKNSQTLNWQSSIVDLMKLLGMDSSFSKRKELARELGFSGDENDSAAMNIWLQKQVMQKLSQNGGKVPPELLH